MNSLHEAAVQFAKEYLSLEHKLIDILQKIDDCKLYLKMGYSSLFQYCVSALSLSESQSFYFTTVARKAKEVPELKKAIESGEINLSKARRIVPVINKENKDIWIEKAKSLPQRELEFHVAAENPKIIKEKIKPIAIDRVSLQLSISKELNAKLEEIKNILSQKKSTHVTLEEILLEMAELFLEKHSPARKAERALNKNIQAPSSGINSASKVCQPVKNTNSNLRVPIPAQIKHVVTFRDKNQCTYQDRNQQRCQNSRWLHMHHVKPVSMGGQNTANNLTTLCSAHHKFLHQNNI
jgi:glutaredoxin